ncbi:hypothetical protein AAY473_032040 [Plecturocebus cupreus]
MLKASETQGICPEHMVWRDHWQDLKQQHSARAMLQNPLFGRPSWANHLRSGVRDQPCKHDETPSLVKDIQKLASGIIMPGTFRFHVPTLPAFPWFMPLAPYSEVCSTSYTAIQTADLFHHKMMSTSQFTNKGSTPDPRVEVEVGSEDSG